MRAAVALTLLALSCGDDVPVPPQCAQDNDMQVFCIFDETDASCCTLDCEQVSPAPSFCEELGGRECVLVKTFASPPAHYVVRCSDGGLLTRTPWPEDAAAPSD